MPLVLGPNEAGSYLDRNEAPGSFVDMLTAAGYRSAVAGLRLGVFAALASGPRPLPVLAKEIGADPRGLGLLADVLVSFGYLSRNGETYANTPMTETWLADRNGYAIVELFWQRVLFQMWDNLEESVRTGEPATDFYTWLRERPDTLRHFQSMLGNHAALLADEVVAAIPVPPGGSLLDLGGGHARYAVALCACHPGLRATVFDAAEALAVGGNAVAAAGLGDRITLSPGDFMRDDFGSGYDVVLLFNVLHGYPAEANRELLGRVAAALNPGGTAVILEHGADPPASEGVTGAAFLQTFSLNLFHGQGGQVYRLDDIVGWLTTAGLTLGTPVSRPLVASPTQHLLLATRP